MAFDLQKGLTLHPICFTCAELTKYSGKMHTYFSSCRWRIVGATLIDHFSLAFTIAANRRSGPHYNPVRATYGWRTRPLPKLLFACILRWINIPGQPDTES